MAGEDDGFMARWSRRKAQAQRGTPPPEPAAAPAPPPLTPAAPAASATPEPVPAAPAAPLPTMDDVAQLTHGSDYSRFVARGIDEGVKRAAMKKLFSDPRFNVMDGLDVYIEDYNVSTPIPPSELRQMAQAKFLGLFDDEAEPAAPPAPLAAAPAVAPDGAAAPPLSQSDAAATDVAAPTPQNPDEDPDLRLQPDDAAGRPGAEARARPAGG